MAEDELIDGPAGPLQVRAEGTTGPLCVIAHPHPLYGGTLDNKVVFTLAKAWRARGGRTLRFNFRGVGRSGGEHDAGTGEQDDLAAVVGFGRSRSGGEPVCLAGFSFGAGVVARAADRLQARHALLVAPPVGMSYFPDDPPRVPVAVVHGRRDDLVAVDGVRAWCQARSVAYRELEDADHFFHGQLPALGEALSAHWDLLERDPKA